MDQGTLAYWVIRNTEMLDTKKIAEDLVFNSVLTELSTQLSRTQMTRLHKKDYFKGKIV